MTASTTPPVAHTERVSPWNGKQEDRWVFFTLVSLLILASVLMQWLYPTPQPSSTPLPNEIRQQLTSLSNAAEEILMIQSFEGQPPNLSTLQAMGIAPFEQVQLAGMATLQWAQNETCFHATGHYPLPSSDDSLTAPLQAFQLTLSFPTQHHETLQTKGHDVSHDAPSYLIHWRLLEASDTPETEPQSSIACDPLDPSDHRQNYNWQGYTPRPPTP